MSSLLTKTNQSGSELEIVKFFREQVMFCPAEADLLTETDMDEHKLPALDKLLRCMGVFRREMASVNLLPQPSDKNKKWKDEYVLTDKEYEDFHPFQIRVRSEHFDPDWFLALHAGFSFTLQVDQGLGHGREIADWIDLSVKYFNIVPSSLASHREHVKCLEGFLTSEGRSHLYFSDIPMKYSSSVSSKRMSHAWRFHANLFKQTIDDACMVMEKIIRRKAFLKVVNVNE